MNRWELAEKKASDLQKQIDILKEVNEMINATTRIGYIRDNNKVVKISDCKDSTLRRLVTKLTKMFKSLNLREHRLIVLDKLKEIEQEQQNRQEEETTHDE